MADILCFDKGGRTERYELATKGMAPREFFYGVTALQERGYDIKQLSSSVPYSGLKGILYRIRELAWSHLTHLGMRTHYIDSIRDTMQNAKVAVSFTDGFSVTLGHYYRNKKDRAPYLIGCFHGLSDLERKAPKILRPVVSKIIRRALHRLDHIAFFGPADREYGVKQYGISVEKTGMILFGIDTEFWKPGTTEGGDYVFSVGQDTNRDFVTLVNAPVEVTVRIHTGLPLSVPAERTNVLLTRGSYQRSQLTDIELRDLYQRAMAVVVPLKDVYQPSGYSVTLQAMACGKPVILSRIRGLWAPQLLRDGENCLLVTPGDTQSLAMAINNLSADPELRLRLGKAARNTAIQHFSLESGAASTEHLIRLGLNGHFAQEQH